ncbi:MAG: CDP-diacylglycerol--glycerol-3-phosphate 3-phosphatidyltransferase [Pseudomonadota bacterium]
MTFKWLPNALTIARCGLAFVVGWAILALSPFWALVLFVATALSDFFDGYAARRLDAVSAFGSFLDPVADKLLVAAALIALCVQQDWALLITVPTMIIILRDTAVTVFRLFPSIKLPVVNLAKWKTALEMVGIGCVLGAPLIVAAQSIITYAGLVLIWLAALLSAYTGVRYAGSALSQMQNDRA